MANISLDIKANTQKALGEFKKLSRELDNKFLVQGLKLDVVKNAFTQINREFENAVGQQGLRAAESSGQLQRSLALNLTTFKRFGRETAEVVSKDVLNSLQQLRAEGTITGKILQDSLNIAGFLDFDASGPELQRKLRESTTTIAKFVQETSDLFGSDQGQRIQQALTGQISVDDLFQVATGQGGAATNAFKKVFQEYQDRLRNADPTIRTQAILEVIKKLESDPAYEKSFRQIKPIESVFREINGLFSEKGLFGALRAVGGKIENFDGDEVDRNLLQVTGKLLRTLFDREDGVFAKLNKALQKAFGDFDVLEPILSGAEFLTGLFKKLGNFFESPEFQAFLSIFDGVVEGVKSIFNGGKLDFSVDNINELIDGIFGAIKGLINKAAEFIKGLDAGAIGSILGNIIEELLGTIGPLLNLAFAALGKSLQVAFSNPTTGIVASIVGALGLGKGLNSLLGGQGIRAGIVSALRRQIGGGGRDEITGQRFNGFQSQVLRYLDLILRQLGGGTPFGPAEAPDRRRPQRRPSGPSRRPSRGFRPPRLPRLPRFSRFPGRASAYTSPIGPLPINSAENWARRGRLDPMSSRGGALYSPRLESGVVRDRFFDARNAMSPFSSQQGFLRGGIGFNKGNALNRGLIGTQNPDVASRFASRYGTRGILARGAGRAAGGIAGAALNALLIGGIFSGGAAQAAEIDKDDSLTKEQKEFFKAENKKNTRQQAGRAAIGIASGALGGAIGSLFGPIGTIVGGAIGSALGDVISDVVGPGVLEAVGKFVEDIGKFFGDLWGNAVKIGGSFVEGFKNFFGPEGPIVSIGKFLYELPGNILKTIQDKFEEVKQGFADLPGNLLNGIKNFFGGDGDGNDKDGKALGGVGSGMTLVGENGPELVNLGSGANVIPNSSLMGRLYGNFRGVSGQTPIINNNITINIDAPGADEFSDQLTDAVIAELNRQYNLQEAQ
jgi:hypothetical protein